MPNFMTDVWVIAFKHALSLGTTIKRGFALISPKIAPVDLGISGRNGLPRLMAMTNLYPQISG